MARPALVARIEEFDTASGERVAPVCLRAFEAVAQATSLPKVFFIVCAAARFWLDMLEFELTKDVSLCSKTIATTATGCCAYALLHCSRNLAHG